MNHPFPAPDERRRDADRVVAGHERVDLRLLGDDEAGVGARQGRLDEVVHVAAGVAARLVEQHLAPVVQPRHDVAPLLEHRRAPHPVEAAAVDDDRRRLAAAVQVHASQDVAPPEPLRQRKRAELAPALEHWPAACRHS